MTIAAQDRNSRQSILACAARLFSRQGYAATSLRGIAAETGITAASLYYHFGSKEEIVVEVLNIGVQSVHAEVKRAVEALGNRATARALLEAAIGAHLRSLHELQDFTSANTRIFGQVQDHVRAATLKVRKSYEDFWGLLLARIVGTGQIRADADLGLLRLLLFGAMNGTLEWYRADGPSGIEDIARIWSDFLLNGTAPRGARAR